MGTLVDLLFSVVLASSACVTLAPNETAVVDPSEYFGDDVSNIQIKSAGDPHASILSPEDPIVLFRIQTKGENWYFGPSVLVGRLQFFTVVYPSEMEVWRADGDWVEEVWTVQASVGQVTPLLTGELAAFVYWTLRDLRLFVVDLNSSDLTAKEISGVDTTNISRITVCEKSNWIFIASQVEGFLTYAVDYFSLTAVKMEKQLIKLADEEVLYALCILDVYLLTRTAFILIEGKIVANYPIPASLGAAKVLRYYDDSRYMYIQAEKGSILYSRSEMFLLPGVLQVFNHLGSFAYLEYIDSRIMLTISSTERPKRVPLHQELHATDDFLWISSPPHRYPSILAKSGAYIAGFAVPLSGSLLVASSHSVPYTIDLCGVDHTSHPVCTNVTVLTASYQPGGIRIENCQKSGGNSTLYVQRPLIGRNIADFLIIDNLLSGSNMKYELSFPILPPDISIKSNSLNQESKSELKVQVAYSDKCLLCASMSKSEIIVLLRQGDEVIEVSKLRSTVLFNTTLSVLSCDIKDTFYALYAEDLKQGYLYIHTKFDISQCPLHMRGFLSMIVAGSHILVLMKNGVHVVGVECVLWQRLAGEYLEMRESEGTLVLRSARYFEVYVLRGSTYVSRGRASVPPSTTLFAFSKEALLALHDNSLLSVFHLSSFSRLVFKFAVELDCPALGLLAESDIAAYYCSTHIQVLRLTLNKNSFFKEKFDLDSIPIYLKMLNSALYKVHRKSDVLEVWEVWIDDSSTTYAITIQISEQYEISGSTSIQGQLAVASPDSLQYFTVNITLENHGAVIVPSACSLPNLQYNSADSTYTLELQWGDTYRLSPLDLFQGHSMQVTAESDWVHTKVSSPVSVLYSVPFPHSYGVVALAPEISTLFAVSDSELIASEYQCEKQSCKIVSEYSTLLREIGVSKVFQMELLVTLGQLAYLFIFGFSTNESNVLVRYELVLCYSRNSPGFTEALRLPFNLWPRSYHIVPGGSTFHLLFFSVVLEHCIAQGTLPMHCTEVVEPALVQVLTVGSVKVSGQCWRLYAVTKLLRLFTLELCEKVTLLHTHSLRLENLLHPYFAIAGDRLLEVTREFFQVLSLPNQVLLVNIQGLQVYASHLQFQIPKLASENPIQFITRRVKLGKYHLLDLLAPANSLVLVQFLFETFTFTANNYGVGIANHTASVLRFSRGEIVLTGDSGWVETVSTEVTVTASNRMGATSARIRVVLPARKWLLWGVAVAIVGVSAAFMRFKRNRETMHEVEMERIN